MPTFIYTATDKSGKRHEGNVEAANEIAVGQLLSRQGLRALVIKKEQKK
jgi:type II secretory pathway component PulF